MMFSGFDNKPLVLKKRMSPFFLGLNDTNSLHMQTRKDIDDNGSLVKNNDFNTPLSPVDNNLKSHPYSKLNDTNSSYVDMSPFTPFYDHNDTKQEK